MPRKQKQELNLDQEDPYTLFRNELRKIKFRPQSVNKKEMPSIGLACICSGKILPDPDCPLHCGDIIKG